MRICLGNKWTVNIAYQIFFFSLRIQSQIVQRACILARFSYKCIGCVCESVCAVLCISHICMCIRMWNLLWWNASFRSFSYLSFWFGELTGVNEHCWNSIEMWQPMRCVRSLLCMLLAFFSVDFYHDAILCRFAAATGAIISIER